jgi:hypothetical protein
VRGWAANVTAEINRQKQSVSAKYTCLNIEYEDIAFEVF